jgi:hypothetical protein
LSSGLAWRASRNRAACGGLSRAALPGRSSASAYSLALSCSPFPAAAAGDLGRLGSIVDPSYEYWGLIDLGGRQGVAGMAAMMGGWRDALSDFEIGADWVVAAEGGRVLFRWVLQVGGVDGGAWMGAEGTVKVCVCRLRPRCAAWASLYLLGPRGFSVATSAAITARTCR